MSLDEIMAICMIDKMLKIPRQMQPITAIIPAAKMVAGMTIRLINDVPLV